MDNEKQKVHFIAIGGSIMHNLAIALHNKGMQVSGSDDDIYDPAKSLLSKHGLLPESLGWHPARINSDIDAVILGMHAKKNNPELLKAQELGLKIFSFPEYVFEQSKNKQRIVIAGSHGKTTITAIILHVLKQLDREFDYLVGAQISGFETMVKLSDAPIIIIEGDEYLSSPLDKTPKLLKYHHHIGLVSGIAWDHYNVFPKVEEYVKQFELFADATPKAGTLIYCSEDDMATIICAKERNDVAGLPYEAHDRKFRNGTTYLLTDNGEVPVKLFGKHNLQNLNGAKAILRKLGITDEQFYKTISSFEGASNRLQLFGENSSTAIFKDFAHAPSKAKASIRAVKERYSGRELVACLELHTFSSLNKNFISQYKGSMEACDIPIVFYDPESVAKKMLEELSEADIKAAFARPDLNVFTNKNDLKSFLSDQSWDNKNLLFMSSGTFNELDIDGLKEKIL